MLQKIVSKSHLLAGIEYYQEEYPEHEVMFLAVSDDMDWVKRHLVGIKGVVMAGSLLDHRDHELHHEEQHDLDPAVMDLALLSSCNHSIVTQVKFESAKALF